jgi:putative Mn2+ efflux pump MntP
VAEGKEIPGGSNVFFYFLAVLLGMLALVLAEWFYFSNRENWPAALIIAIIGIGLLIYPIIHYLILQDGNRPRKNEKKWNSLESGTYH